MSDYARPCSKSCGCVIAPNTHSNHVRWGSNTFILQMRKQRFKEVKFNEPMRHGEKIGTQATCPSEPPSFQRGETCPRWHCPKRVAWKLERYWPQSWPGFRAAGDEKVEKGCVLERFLVCLLGWQSGLWLCDGDRQIGMKEGVNPPRVRQIGLSGFLSLWGPLPMLEVQEAVPRPPTASHSPPCWLCDLASGFAS